MKKMQKLILGVLVSLIMAGTAQAAIINVTSNISSSDTWTADNEYHLKGGAIYVLPGATLNIQAGTKIIGYTKAELVAENPSVTDSSALVVAKGGLIFADGTATNPIVFTVPEDNRTNWQPISGEWGGLVLLGDAIIAEGTNCAGNQNGTCWDNMEGLTVGVNSRYGGNNDDNSIGRVQYVSLRYGGAVVGLANEVNGISIGGVGRESDIHHIDILNNIDDGIEIWGGTVQLKYINIWNIGDDSFDLDEGYRGKAQFVLAVQGYANLVGPQESGWGDNLFEMDGGENPTLMQPYANPQVFNVTAIGQNPAGTSGGDHALTYRDNMRMQLGNSIFMNIGDDIVNLSPGNVAEMTAAFTTDNFDTYNAAGVTLPIVGPVSTISTMADFYSDSRSGKWSWIKDTIFKDYEDAGSAAAVGLFAAENRNLNNPAADPVKLIARDNTVGQPLGMEIVTNLDPRAAGDAVFSGVTAPADGFFTPVPFKGAFSPNVNWLCGWTAADEFNMTVCNDNAADPAGTMQLAASTSFATVAGVYYTVEKSADGKEWTPVGTVVGNGSTMSAADLANYNPAMLYRVIAQ